MGHVSLTLSSSLNDSMAFLSTLVCCDRNCLSTSVCCDRFGLTPLTGSVHLEFGRAHLILQAGQSMLYMFVHVEVAIEKEVLQCLLIPRRIQGPAWTSGQTHALGKSHWRPITDYQRGCDSLSTPDASLISVLSTSKPPMTAGKNTSNSFLHNTGSHSSPQG